MFPLILLIDYEILFNNNLLVRILRIENIYILHFNLTSDYTSLPFDCTQFSKETSSLLDMCPSQAKMKNGIKDVIGAVEIFMHFQVLSPTFAYLCSPLPTFAHIPTSIHNWVFSRGGTLLWDNRRLIGRSLIVLARQVQNNRD